MVKHSRNKYLWLFTLRIICIWKPYPGELWWKPDTCVYFLQHHSVERSIVSSGWTFIYKAVKGKKPRSDIRLLPCSTWFWYLICWVWFFYISQGSSLNLYAVPLSEYNWDSSNAQNTNLNLKSHLSPFRRWVCEKWAWLLFLKWAAHCLKQQLNGSKNVSSKSQIPVECLWKAIWFFMDEQQRRQTL